MRTHKLGVLAAITLVLLPGAASVLGASYTLIWWTADGGGGMSSAPGYVLNGTIGQTDAGVLAGGGYTLGGGFWRGGEFVGNTVRVYLPLVLRQTP